jgi:hypothetical protein
MRTHAIEPSWRDESIWNINRCPDVFDGVMETSEEHMSEQKDQEGGQQHDQGGQPSRIQQAPQQTPKPQEERQFDDDKLWEQGGAASR